MGLMMWFMMRGNGSQSSADEGRIAALEEELRQLKGNGGGAQVEAEPTRKSA
jgi:hypothetical protein